MPFHAVRTLNTRTEFLSTLLGYEGFKQKTDQEQADALDPSVSSDSFLILEVLKVPFTRIILKMTLTISLILMGILKILDVLIFENSFLSHVNI
jgi:hypothetical protein